MLDYELIYSILSRLFWEGILLMVKAKEERMMKNWQCRNCSVIITQEQRPQSGTCPTGPKGNGGHDWTQL